MKNLAFILALIGVILIETIALNETVSTRDQYKRNTEVLMSEVDTFRTRNDELVAKTDALTLKLADFNKLEADNARLAKELKSSNEKLKQYIGAETKTVIDTIIIARDSIVYVNEKVDTLQVYEWNDSWDKVLMAINGQEAAVKIEHRDLLKVYVYADYKRFLGFLWRTKIKGLDVAAVSMNPHTTEVDIESVEIQ